ncbi:MAG: hypothetical protein H0Z33_11680 [Bacillaceae bacterium]|nr:hypothetical protein [Bacillaceae bacterium]
MVTGVKYRLRSHPWYYKFRAGLKQFIAPLMIFQLIRTLIFPTALDVIILLLFIATYAGLEMGWL